MNLRNSSVPPRRRNTSLPDAGSSRRRCATSSARTATTAWSPSEARRRNSAMRSRARSPRRIRSGAHAWTSSCRSCHGIAHGPTCGHSSKTRFASAPVRPAPRPRGGSTSHSKTGARRPVHPARRPLPWGGPMFDYLIVGAGFAGSVMAERLAADAGKKVLIIDKRPHIGGNAYDQYDDAGILVHKYGPHIFHTNSKPVFEYLSKFTEWHPYQHRVQAWVDGQLVPIPINLETVNRLYGLTLTSFEVDKFFESLAEKRPQIKTSEDVIVSKVGRELYEKFFRNYTRKQWDLDPSELDAQVTARVPVRTNRDDRYFTDTYQAMPRYGLTRMFEKMLSHPNIKIMLNVDYREIMKVIPHGEVIYTGPVDEYFDYRYGRLPYRSLE